MKIQSYSDIITNSSSELFVFEKGETVEQVIKTLDEIYPEWRTEYDDPKYLKDNDLDSLDTYYGYSNYGGYYREREKRYYCQKHGIQPRNVDCFTFYDVDLSKVGFDKNVSCASSVAAEFGLTPEEMYTNWDEYNPCGNWIDSYLEVSDKGLEAFVKKFGNQVTLWSKDQNPDWDYQEKLMEVAHRYHLG